MKRRRFLADSAVTGAGMVGLGGLSFAWTGCSNPDQETKKMEKETESQPAIEQAPETTPQKLQPVALISDERYLHHIPGLGHPESPARAASVMKAFNASDIPFRRLEPRHASMEEIRSCHTAEYVKTAVLDIEAGKSMLSTGDTHISKDSLDVALLAAGGVCVAVDEVFSADAASVDRAFCVVRPPGHHAEANKGMGFCVFGNIAVGARYAQSKHGAERVLIVDWDVHHGNGTQDIFYDDPSVFFFSSHQSPWYPGTGDANETGSGKGEGTTLNAPLASGSGRAEVFEQAFRQQLRNAVKDFKPDLVMISAGFDSRIDDPLGQFVLEDQDFTDLTLFMRELAHETAGGRVVSVLEGGYNLDGLAAAATAHVRALAEPA